MLPVLYLRNRLDTLNEPFAGYLEPVVEPDCFNLALPDKDIRELQCVLGEVERQFQYSSTEADVISGAFCHLEKDREVSRGCR